MKAIVKFFCILVVSAVVLTGALYILEGVRAHQAQSVQSAQQTPAPLFHDLDSQEGTAL